MPDREFVCRMIAWFQENGRILPWRMGRESYRIWISEIMLQQTRIEAVIPYYHRFLEELPTVQALAECPDDKLLKLWEGLGYYSRARNLKKAAAEIVSRFGGELPHKAEQLRTLPGIGDYTAGAIASIAYGEPCPAVDGNVLRVVARYTGDERDIMLSSTKKDVAAALKEIYPAGREAGDLTEGIMELGERICIPNGVPLCPACPLQESCRACLEKSWDRIPFRSAKAKRKTLPMTVFLLEKEGRYALRKRPDTGLLAGMWEFYHETEKRNSSEAAALLRLRGFDVREVIPLGTAKHIFTHLEWHMVGYRVRIASGGEELLWVSATEISQHYALPTAFRTFLKAIHEGEN